ncbi:uncharacterized protein LOC114340409 isoform X2 [Diabrotica virgifera virgifera]|uniref:SIAH-type domain-containing protein n=1 Tax=Diabrotica virgifera virgifera TaxID=50390 RepID=A0ABM5IXE4_DIAVI|nr:uncharacterized protein LOC114340409 isoform X2 [Diabrotica virgifera virgifera]
MAFIVPDKVLESLICTFCHKYLSVKPTTVYPNRDVECGRCVMADKQEKQRAAVESLYGKIAEKCVFKCINRFDGCRELLTYSQVLDHEKVCLENIHKCPICYEEMTSFMMLQHFHSNHKDAILDSSAFPFNLKHYLETTGIYIYQEEDNLFFLYISYSKSENTIKLELVYMGSDKLASNIYHQFTVTSENKEFDINCKSKPSCANEFSIVDVSNMSHLINVKFKLIYQNAQFFTIPENVYLSSIENSLENLNQNLKDLTISENVNSSSSSTNNSLEEPEPSERKIHLIYSSPSNYTTQIVEFPLECHPQCINCKEICIFSLSDPYAPEYYYSPTHDVFLCFCCFEWLTHENKIEENYLYMKKLMNKNYLARFCKWNCGQHFKFSEIISHEIFCEKRNHYYNCPVQNCSTKGFASALRKHLETEHRFSVCTSIIQLANTTMNHFVFLEDQIVRFKLECKFIGGDSYCGIPSRYEYKIECEIITNDNEIESEWKPHVLCFSGNTFKPLSGLPLSSSPSACKAKIVLVKK